MQAASWLGQFYIHRLHLHLELPFPVQPHDVSALGLVEGPRHSKPAVEVLPARAGDHHALAHERAQLANDAGADFLVDSLQAFDRLG